jgi:hypothetical protein
VEFVTGPDSTGVHDLARLIEAEVDAHRPAVVVLVIQHHAPGAGKPAPVPPAIHVAPGRGFRRLIMNGL